MAKYVLLYSGGRQGATPAEQQKILQQWGNWFGKMGNAVVDAGNPFSEKVKSIASNAQVKDGAIGTRATGYSIVEAGSIDAASALAKECPVLDTGGQVTVYEVQPAM